jgi:hypothetical protein
MLCYASLNSKQKNTLLLNELLPYQLLKARTLVLNNALKQRFRN